eukprot:11191842-Lingulodinium_polyedra.AAC.1
MGLSLSHGVPKYRAITSGARGMGPLGGDACLQQSNPRQHDLRVALEGRLHAFLGDAKTKKNICLTRAWLTTRAACMAAWAWGANAATNKPRPPKLPAILMRLRAMGPNSPAMATTASSNYRYTGPTTGAKRTAPTKRAS